MEGKFHSYVIEELRHLLSDIECGLQPSNIVLNESVFSTLREQYDRKTTAKNTTEYIY